MFLILGTFIVFSCVFGGYLLANGQLLALWQPNEIVIITGAALGSFVISNPWSVIRNTVVAVFNLIFGQSYKQDFYVDLFLLLYKIGAKIKRNGLLSIEEDTENPFVSTLFGQHPQILADQRLMTFINDNLRVIVTGNITTSALEELFINELQLLEEELEKPAIAIEVIADAFPGFGIVAAVLGIVITMQSLGGDPNVLGFKIAAALVGTFLGVLLSYGLVGPIGIALGNQSRRELKAYYCVKIFILAFVSGVEPKIAIENARRTLYADIRPAFLDLEKIINSLH